MSEFYAQRRTSIKDGVALVAFMLGWFAAGPVAWPYISEAFDQGDPAKGVLRFFGVVFVGGLAFGAAGLLLGQGAGYVWERWHKHRRLTHPPVDRDAESGEKQVLRSAQDDIRQPLPPLRIERGNVNAVELLALLAKTGSPALEDGRVAQSLQGSITIGAWDGDRLVGVARVITDGAVTAMLADLAVDPELQHRGLGRILLGKAYDATPRGELSIVAPRGTGPFFEAAGCDRAVASFVLRRPVR